VPDGRRQRPPQQRVRDLARVVVPDQAPSRQQQLRPAEVMGEQVLLRGNTGQEMQQTAQRPDSILPADQPPLRVGALQRA
jgi:hypothetical protein